MIGHSRFLLEAIGPELRQYIVTANDEERPFTRDERRWMYASSKRQQLLRIRYRQRLRAHGRLHRPPPHIPVGSRPTAPRSGGFAALGESHRRAARTSPPLPPALAGEHLGVELRGAPDAVEAMNRGAVRPDACRTRARAGWRRRIDRAATSFPIGTATSAVATSGVGSACPNCRRRSTEPPLRVLESSSARGRSRGSAGAAGAKVTREIADTRGVPVGVDCLAPRGARRAATSTRCSTSSSCSRPRPACRSGSSRRSAN